MPGLEGQQRDLEEGAEWAEVMEEKLAKRCQEGRVMDAGMMAPVAKPLLPEVEGQD